MKLKQMILDENSRKIVLMMISIIVMIEINLITIPFSLLYSANLRLHLKCNPRDFLKKQHSGKITYIPYLCGFN
jgi:hypothetical protein